MLVNPAVSEGVPLIDLEYVGALIFPGLSAVFTKPPDGLDDGTLTLSGKDTPEGVGLEDGTESTLLGRETSLLVGVAGVDLVVGTPVPLTNPPVAALFIALRALVFKLSTPSTCPTLLYSPGKDPTV